MTTIRAVCPVCDEVAFGPSAVWLSVCVNDLRRSTYAFRCPECRDVVQRQACHHAIELLRAGGVRAVLWRLPAEAREPRDGPALTCDDLIDLAAELASTDDLVPLVTARKAG